MPLQLKTYLKYVTGKSCLIPSTTVSSCLHPTRHCCCPFVLVQKKKMKEFLLIFLLSAYIQAAPVEGPGKINDLLSLNPYQPEKPPTVPIVLGERSKSHFL